MKLIIGLGNIGNEYQNTRHNVGFMAVDYFADKNKLEFKNTKLKAMISKGKIANEDVIIAKPTTYMNLSGEALSLITKFYQIDTKDILVIYDDLDLDTGKIRIRKAGSAGGQNGMKNIIQHIKTENIARVRIGISKSPIIPTKDYVLGKFTSDEFKTIHTALATVELIINDFITKDIDYIMNRYNKK